MIQVHENMLMAIVAAVLYAASGYFKQQPREPFNNQKFATTIVIGVVIGIGEVLTGMSYDLVFSLLVSAGAVVLIENLMKAVWRVVENYPKNGIIGDRCGVCLGTGYIILPASAAHPAYQTCCGNCGGSGRVRK
jgi:hypothetical protein